MEDKRGGVEGEGRGGCKGDANPHRSLRRENVKIPFSEISTREKKWSFSFRYAYSLNTLEDLWMRLFDENI